MSFVETPSSLYKGVYLIKPLTQSKTPIIQSKRDYTELEKAYNAIHYQCIPPSGPPTPNKGVGVGGR